MRRSRKILLAVCCVVCAVCVGGTVFYVTYKNKGKTEEASMQASKENIAADGDYLDHINEPDENGSYIRDVAYDGTEDVDLSVMDYPFKLTDDYISNRQLQSMRDEIYFERSKKFAEDYLNAQWNIGYRELEAGTEDYIEKTGEFYLPGATLIDDITVPEYLQQIADYCIKNKIQAEAKAESAKYLVYSDGMTHVRGVLEITSYNCDVESTEEELGVELARDGKYIFDISLYNGGRTDGQGYSVYSTKIIDEIK